MNVSGPSLFFVCVWVSFPLKQKQVCKANKSPGLSDSSHQIKEDLWCV